MYEYEIYSNRINEHDFVYGYSINDMKRKNPNIDWSVWKIIRITYVD